MTRFRGACVAGVVCVVASVMVGATGRTAAAGEPPRIREYVDIFASTAPATGTARRIRIDHFNPHNADGKPFAISRQVIEFHPGTIVDTSAVPRCAASDAELLARGATACPETSIVGTGEFHVDTGVPGPFRIVGNDLTLFNASHELIILSRSRGTPLPIPFVVREKVRGNTLDLSLPPLPGTPPDGAAPTLQDIRLDNRWSFEHGRRLNFITTPPTCPASGEWSNRITITFRDGLAQTVASTSPCTPTAVLDSTPPRIRITGFPRDRCVKQDLRVQARLSDRGAGLQRARLYVDGRLLRQTRRLRLSVRIEAGRLRPGLHRVTVVAVDRAGNRAVRTLRFRRCR